MLEANALPTEPQPLSKSVLNVIKPFGENLENVYFLLTSRSNKNRQFYNENKSFLVHFALKWCTIYVCNVCVLRRLPICAVCLWIIYVQCSYVRCLCGMYTFLFRLMCSRVCER